MIEGLGTGNCCVRAQVPTGPLGDACVLWPSVLAPEADVSGWLVAGAKEAAVSIRVE
jgi:hypothetical protein